MIRMSRLSVPVFAAILAAGLGGCSLFEDEERLPGERIPIRSESQPGATLAAAPGRPLPAAVRNRDWMQTNALASHAAGNLEGPAELRRVWSADAGSAGAEGAAITGAPIVLGGRVFTLDGEARVSAFEEGREIWRTDLTLEGESGEDGFGGGLASDGTRVFATTGFGEVVALSSQTGEVLWRHRGQAPFRAAPAVDSGIVVAVNRDNRAIALRAETGEVLWRITGFTSATGVLGGASPAISGGLAAIPFASGEVIGAELRSGRRVWSAVLGGARRGLARASISDVTGDPVIAGRIVVAANQSGRIVAIDGATGRRGWSVPSGAAGPLWAAGDSIFLVTDDSALLRVKIQTGESVWRTELPAFEDPEDREDPIAYSGPVIVSGRVLVTDTLGNLISFNADTGERLGAIDIASGTTTGPVVADGTVYVLSGNGTLEAFR